MIILCKSGNVCAVTWRKEHLETLEGYQGKVYTNLAHKQNWPERQITGDYGLACAHCYTLTYLRHRAQKQENICLRHTECLKCCCCKGAWNRVKRIFPGTCLPTWSWPPSLRLTSWPCWRTTWPSWQPHNLFIYILVLSSYVDYNRMSDQSMDLSLSYMG